MGNSLKETLEHLEYHLQRMVEHRAARLLHGTNLGEHIVHHLVVAMGANLKEDENGDYVAPNHYIVGLHPSVSIDLQNDPEIEERLSDTLREGALDAGFRFPSRPIVRLVEDPDVPPGEPRVLAEFRKPVIEPTKDLTPYMDGGPPNIPPNAFLIINGTRVFPLTHPVVNVGRRLDNHLVIEDPRVSRLHAQLRVVKENFVLFDLGSTGGTFVNGQRINQCFLYPGDVISLAGVTLVFGQDAPRPLDDDIEYTRPLTVEQFDGDQTFDSETSPNRFQ